MSFTVTLTPTGGAIPSELVNVIKGDPGGGGGGGTIPVNEGGTGATTAAGARTNLGVDAAGTAASAAAAAVGAHAGGAGVHGIAGVNGLQAALDAKDAALAEHTAASDPHPGYVLESEVGVSVAGLVAGKVPSAQLPSFVDDVIEAANAAALPGTGETGKIYVTLDDGLTWRWGGSAYVEISPSPGSTDAVPEGATNQYFTVARVRAAVLTGLSTAVSAAITAADTVLSALGKLQAQLGGKQDTLVSGASIKTVNGASLLGAGDLTVSGGASVAGADTQVQFNDGGALGASTGFTFDKTYGRLGLSGLLGNSYITPTYDGSMSLGSLGGAVLQDEYIRTSSSGKFSWGAGSQWWNYVAALTYSSSVVSPRDDSGNLIDFQARNLIATGNLATGMAAKTADYTLTVNDGAISFDASAAARTATLPALSTCQAGQLHFVWKTDSSGNAVSADANASETINGSTSAFSTTTQWGLLVLQVNADKSGWLARAL